MIELVCTLLSNNFIFTKELSGISKMEQKKKKKWNKTKTPLTPTLVISACVWYWIAIDLGLNTKLSVFHYK